MNQMSTALQPGEVNIGLIPLDWPLTPVGDNKAPYIIGWQANPQSIEDIKTHIETGRCKAVGLLSGPVYNEPYGLVWVDIDGPTVYSTIENVSGLSIKDALPKTLTICSGREGRERKLYKIPKSDFQYFIRNKYAWQAEGDGEKLEVLWKRHQGVLMGAHPKTAGYYTKEGEDFNFVKELPVLPQWILNAIKTKNNKQGKPRETQARLFGENFAVNTVIGLDYEIKEAVRALWTLPIEHVEDYDCWLAAGQALHSIDDTLFEEWEKWSKQSDKYQPGVCKQKWQSFTSNGGITAGTLYKAAKENGFQFSQDHKAMPVSDESIDALSELLSSMLNDEPQMPPEVMQSSWMAGSSKSEEKEKSKRNESEDVIRSALIGLLQGNVLFDPSSNKFHWYEHEAYGLWSPLSESEMKGKLWDDLLPKLKDALLPKGFNKNLVDNMYDALSQTLIHEEWNDNKHLILFTNGVYNLKEDEIGGFQRDYYISRSLPCDFDPQATCEPIIDWLKFTQFGDNERVQLLRAWMRAVLTSADDIQRFVEIIGPAKSGKSTFTNLCHALVGFDNAMVSTLQRIESNRFELAQLPGKKLLLFNDVERYGGSVSNLKVLTGSDLANSEHKFKSEQRNFKFDGLIMMTASEQIQSTDPSSGLFRRRITIPFERPFTGNAKEQCVLINCDRRGTVGKFAEYLPGLINWLLDMSRDEMREYLIETNRKVAYYRKFSAQQQTRSNPLLDWLHHNIVWEPGATALIGQASRAPKDASTKYANVDKKLYPNYCEFCENNGVGNVGRARFEALLIDALVHQLKLNVYKASTRTVRMFNIRIRQGGDDGSGVDNKFPSPVELSQDVSNYEEFYKDLHPNKSYKIRHDAKDTD